MKRTLLVSAILTNIVVMSSCSHHSGGDDELADAKVPNTLVTLGAFTNIKTVENEQPLQSMTTRATVEGIDSNTVAVPSEITSMPDSLTAYIVADETRGQYIYGEIVDTTVLKGKTQTNADGTATTTYTATDSVPAMKCRVYVSNYHGIKETLNEPFQTSIADLPDASQTLYLYGASDDDIDFSMTKTTSIDINNSYSAVCIRHAAPVSSTAAPEYDDLDEGKQKETLFYYKTDATGTWYYLYIRCPQDNVSSISAKTLVNLEGVAKFADQPYALEQPIIGNNVYTFTFHTGTDTTDAGINIIADPFQKTINEVINIFSE